MRLFGLGQVERSGDWFTVALSADDDVDDEDDDEDALGVEDEDDEEEEYEEEGEEHVGARGELVVASNGSVYSFPPQ